jgi:MOSC domain-containing protein YiiM
MPDIQPSILSIQAGKVARLGASGVLSGFVKRIVRRPVEIAPLGLTGDEQADLSVHGGPDKQQRSKGLMSRWAAMASYECNATPAA